MGDGRKIDGKRVLVDVERGRTVPNWRPRKLGGGLGSSRLDPHAPLVSAAPAIMDAGGGGGGGGAATDEDKDRARARERQDRLDVRLRPDPHPDPHHNPGLGLG
jgi:U1 small nuclear ribonucleoprotein